MGENMVAMIIVIEFTFTADSGVAACVYEDGEVICLDTRLLCSDEPRVMFCSRIYEFKESNKEYSFSTGPLPLVLE